MDKVNNCIEALKKNNMDAHYFTDLDDLYKKIDEYIADAEACGWGGSVTLDQTGVLDHVKKSNCKCLDRDDPANDKESMQIASLSCDVFFMSSNAITEDGKLYNIDGNGNRAGALVYGPKKVVIVAGTNKIVKDLDAAIDRARNIAAPLNTKRLNRKTPCVVTGKCEDCASPERICCHEVLTEYQLRKNRIAVLILEGDA